MKMPFIQLVQESTLPFAQVCARLGISRKTGYKWLHRFRAEGAAGLLERARTPRSHPHRTEPEIERLVLEIQRRHPSWKGGSIRTELARRGITPLPAVTTVDAIRRRLHEANTGPLAATNDCWHLTLGPVSPSSGVNHLAVVVRDLASDFVLAAEVVAERGEDGCREVLWAVFARCGLPRRIQWPETKVESAAGGHTPLTVAVMALGVVVEFYAPTPARSEPENADSGNRARLAAGLRSTGDGAEVQARIAGLTPAVVVDPGRQPNEALSRWRTRLATWADRHNLPSGGDGGARSGPAVRYRPSPRRLEAPLLPTVEGSPRRVSEKGIIHVGGRRWVVGRAFAGQDVHVRTLPEAGRLLVAFQGCPLGILDELGAEADPVWARRLSPVAASNGLMD